MAWGDIWQDSGVSVNQSPTQAPQSPGPLPASGRCPDSLQPLTQGPHSRGHEIGAVMSGPRGARVTSARSCLSRDLTSLLSQGRESGLQVEQACDP